MVLTDQLAVMDLVALGRFALLPDDDLSLAELLKSPLVGLDDDALFALAWQRPGSLWQALTVRREEQPAWQEAWQFLSGLLAATDYVPPYEFYASVLGRGGGRRRLQARLGSEVNDPIDEFLALALHFERLHAPALEAFLHWLAAGEAEVKRDLELGRDEVRVLTVHGAKGLQAPVVFLPDTCRVPSQDDRLLWLEDGERELLLWPVRRKYEVGAADAARQAARQSRLREYRRLLYVAMTRAEDRLYVAGWETSRGRGEGCWYDLVWQGLEDVAESVEGDWGEMRRLVQEPGPDPDRLEKVEPLEPRGRSLPDWATEPPAAEPHPPAPLAPSRPEEEPSVRAPLGADNGLRFRRGNLVHRLLQSLPEVAPEERQRAATRLLEVLAPELAAEARAAIAGETLAVLATPDFAPLFGPGSKAEVPLTARLGDQVLSGQVDRLCVSGDEVLLVDYKTNRPPPDSVDLVAPAYLRQLAAYRAALEIIYPDRTIRCALLWTDGPRLMEIEGKILVHWMP
jgi:ATP-dependent helicase/nuclease subunit A